jgi:hypothetical protein
MEFVCLFVAKKQVEIKLLAMQNESRMREWTAIIWLRIETSCEVV